MDWDEVIEDLPFTIPEDECGEIRSALQVAPGVYYLVTTIDMDERTEEYYVITEDAVPDIISKEAASYGKEHDGCIIFEEGVSGGGWELVEFEVERYKEKEGINIANGSLYEKAIFGSDLYPEYFGGLIPPRMTPWGLTMRWKKAAEGVFFLETVQCVWILALAPPVWDVDLSETAKSFGQTCSYDKLLGESNTAYLYFQRDRCAVAIYELLKLVQYQGIRQYIHSQEALETDIFLHFPEYVVEHNAEEVSGNGDSDMMKSLLKSISAWETAEEVEREEEDSIRRIKNCIHYYPEYEKEELLLLPT